ncbi:CheR family methyltransferase [Legionella pneumophila]|nr:protein-glutamate O-methyltransferase CheR [Legionella pneumophila]HAT1658436.1 tetratricopeptide repeat protein [Legionella pneumophila]HAT1660805.1 tetratricopeptide repeat protein [Legionella pneumophila]HAT1884050.1 tetratricopeptide repeat protein [Legionella pneumophila]HAT2115640.1 tetratricopeptide repeat protein [Legionella pneumophila]HAT8720485.1 tetratricopeptide repeat protein [Legionella pneumophila]
MLIENEIFNPEDKLWGQLSDFLRINTGLNFTKARRLDLYRGIKAAANIFGMQSPEKLARKLISSPLEQKQIEILAKYLAVGETYFFRDRQSFEILEQQILPPLLEKRRGANQRLRIWSVGCCTGEEPYSIAMVVAKLLPNQCQWNITILATDIVMEFLHKATEGIYSAWSFRNVPEGIQETYFSSMNHDHFSISPKIKSMVKFAYLNLIENTYPAIDNGTNAMDIIFCRNVLMYFERTEVHRVVHKLAQSLVEGGWLFLSPVDIPSNVTFPNLVLVDNYHSMIYRKESTFNIDKQVNKESPIILSSTAVDLTLESVELQQPNEAENELLNISEYDKSKQKTAKLHQRFYQKAERRFYQGYYEQAARITKQILAKNPQDSTAMILLARCNANQGFLKEAHQWCKKALDIHKLNKEWWYLYGVILQEEGLHHESIDALKRALFIDQNNIIVHIALANQYRLLGCLYDAERHFKTALEILGHYQEEQVIPESEGLSAGSLTELIKATMINRG